MQKITMKKRFYFILPTLLFGMALGFTGCKKAGDEQVIKVGEFASLTGKEATFGDFLA